MYIYIHIHMYIYIYIHTYTYVYVYMYGLICYVSKKKIGFPTQVPLSHFFFRSKENEV